MKRNNLIILITIFLLSGICFSANEIRAYFPSGNTLYAVIRNSTGQAFDTTGNAFEAWNIMTDYDISLTDHTGGFYTGTFDADVSAGSYSIIVHKQIGGSPADSDPPIQFEEGYWTGSTWKSSRDRLEDITEDTGTTLPAQINDVNDNIRSDTAIIIADTNELQTDWANGGRLDLILDAIKKYTDLIVLVETDVNDSNSTTYFTVTDGSSTADCYNNYLVMVQDATDSHWEVRLIKDWGADLSITTDSAFTFTPASSDLAYIIGWQYLGNSWQRVQELGKTTNIINTISGTGATPSLGTTRFDATGDEP